MKRRHQTPVTDLEGALGPLGDVASRLESGEELSLGTYDGRALVVGPPWSWGAVQPGSRRIRVMRSVR